ncbi:MAG TPA: LLM class flavin-dependent oxidoreductase [Actinomycetes bacterium]|nr:LLM class flavin-dependent oxidoreductase [Actinomycetes bacterium]
MPDYGHDLAFGTFVAPQSARPQHAVELARQTERAGLDLITFMDHPYNPGLLDTWTLLSYVAARTERIRLSGYVLNLPLRPPGLLARAAASLDLLSSGRFELGLGPGDTFTLDAAAAIGGDVPATRGGQIDALSEAIDIIRQTWAVSSSGPMHFAGKHYQVAGERGPKPAHDIAIWVPAGGPRARQLVGRSADGWISGGAWMTDVSRELAAGNRAIDDAATMAGRDPRAIRRIFDFHGTFDRFGRGYTQGSPAQWVDALLPLAVDHGIATFVLVADDAHPIALFGDEVAPALREAVAGARGTVKRSSTTAGEREPSADGYIDVDQVRRRDDRAG